MRGRERRPRARHPRRRRRREGRAQPRDDARRRGVRAKTRARVRRRRRRPRVRGSFRRRGTSEGGGCSSRGFSSRKPPFGGTSSSPTPVFFRGALTPVLVLVRLFRRRGGGVDGGDPRVSRGEGGGGEISRERGRRRRRVGSVRIRRRRGASRTTRPDAVRARKRLRPRRSLERSLERTRKRRPRASGRGRVGISLRVRKVRSSFRQVRVRRRRVVRRCGLRIRA